MADLHLQRSSAWVRHWPRCQVPPQHGWGLHCDCHQGGGRGTPTHPMGSAGSPRETDPSGFRVPQPALKHVLQHLPACMSTASRNPHFTRSCFPLQCLNQPVIWDLEAFCSNWKAAPRASPSPAALWGHRAAFPSLPAPQPPPRPSDLCSLWRGCNHHITAIALSIQTRSRCLPSGQHQWLALPAWGMSLGTETL